MKYLSVLWGILFFLVIAGCRENIIDFPQEDETAAIYIDSTPLGALIYLNDSFTNKYTPNSIQNLSPGEYTVTLKLINYTDTTFTIRLDKGDKHYVSILMNP